MKDLKFIVKGNTALTESIFRMVLEGDISAVTAPGQFVNIQLPGRFLRRPISICDAENGELTLIYKVVGEGTADMAAMQPGTQLDILTGLGNGYDISKAGDCPVLLGGGVGIPPLYMLTKRLIAADITPTVILGFNTKDEIFYEEEFRSLGCRVLVTTVDGSYGIKGYVTNAIDQAMTAAGRSQFSSYFTCGPTPMLKAVHKALDCGGQLSLEERMGCGFGACMGCSIKVRNGYKRVCKDGPVFSSEELLWEAE